ncbi:MAG: RNA polymerase sigma factor [Oscillospiraceae bacterium]|nr:RNA polymerase sigma factor [Oscillospiraceae bacterium]
MIIYLSLLDNQEDHSKFTKLYKTYRYIMMHTAFSILNDHGLAEDAVHDAFVRAAKNFHKIGDVDSSRTKAFMLIIVRNVALTMAKQRGRTFVFEEENIVNVIADSTADKDFENFDFDRIVDAIKALPDTYRDTLYLNVVEGYSTKEISDMLEVSNEAVKKRLQRGRKILIGNLEKEGITYG